MGPAAAAGHSQLHHRLCVYRSAAPDRPSANRPARAAGLRVAPAMAVTRHPLAQRGHRTAGTGAVPLCISFGPCCIPDAIQAIDGGRTHAWARIMGSVWPRGAAAGAPCPGDGLEPDPARNPERHRGVGVSGRAYAHGQHLHHLDHALGSGQFGADRPEHVAVGAAVYRAGTAWPRTAAVCQRAGAAPHAAQAPARDCSLGDPAAGVLTGGAGICSAGSLPCAAGAAAHGACRSNVADAADQPAQHLRPGGGGHAVRLAGGPAGGLGIAAGHAIDAGAALAGAPGQPRLRHTGHGAGHWLVTPRLETGRLHG